MADFIPAQVVAVDADYNFAPEVQAQLSATFVPQGASTWAGAGPWVDVAPAGGGAAFHIHSGEGNTAPYMIGVGVDHDNVTGQTISVKRNGTSRGLYIDMQPTVTDPQVMGFYGKQSSPGTLVKLQSITGTLPKGPLLELVTQQYDTNQIAMQHRVGWPAHVEGTLSWWVSALNGDHHFAGNVVRVAAPLQDPADAGINAGIRFRQLLNNPRMEFYRHAGSGTFWRSAIWQDQNVLKIGTTADPGTEVDGSVAMVEAIKVQRDTGTTKITIATGSSLGHRIGFYGATPVAKPTGVAVDITSVHAALVSLGLIAA